MAFAAGWTPCIGPILGGVLTYTASSADLDRGLVLLFAYSLGLAVPFLLAALMIDRFMDSLSAIPRRPDLDLARVRCAADHRRHSHDHRQHDRPVSLVTGIHS